MRVGGPNQARICQQCGNTFYVPPASSMGVCSFCAGALSTLGRPHPETEPRGGARERLTDESLGRLWQEVELHDESYGPIAFTRDLRVALTELQDRRKAQPEVYVLISHFDCEDVEGVYATLEEAQQAAEEDGEQAFTWTPYNRGEASHLTANPDQWFSSKGDIEGDPLSYVIHKCPIRGQAQPAAAAEGVDRCRCLRENSGCSCYGNGRCLCIRKHGGTCNCSVEGGCIEQWAPAEGAEGSAEEAQIRRMLLAIFPNMLHPEERTTSELVEIVIAQRDDANRAAERADRRADAAAREARGREVELREAVTGLLSEADAWGWEGNFGDLLPRRWADRLREALARAEEPRE